MEVVRMVCERREEMREMKEMRWIRVFLSLHRLHFAEIIAELCSTEKQSNSIREFGACGESSERSKKSRKAFSFLFLLPLPINSPHVLAKMSKCEAYQRVRGCRK